MHDLNSINTKQMQEDEKQHGELVTVLFHSCGIIGYVLLYSASKYLYNILKK